MKTPTFNEALDDPKLLQPWTRKLDLSAWRVYWAAVDGERIDPAHRLLFMQCTRRNSFPTVRAVEAYAAVGRRGGKSANAALRAVYESAIRTSWQQYLARGQYGIYPIISVDRQSSQEIFRYVSGILHSTLLLEGMIESEAKEEIVLKSRCIIQIRVASLKSGRGPSMPGGVLDECTFMHDTETSANPTAEIVAALTPGILPGGLLLFISSVFARQGYFWQMSEKYFGKDGDVLYWRAPTLLMNPTFSKEKIERERQKDPARAAREYDSIESENITGLYSSEAIDAAMIPGRGNLPYIPGIKYFAFIDWSGGRRDSATEAIAFRDANGRIIVAMMIEIRAPFNPYTAVKEFAAMLKAYHLTEVVGDRYAGEWPVAALKKEGITYTLSEKTASELYLAALPLFSGGVIELPESDRLRGQLCSLMRRTSTAGKDQIIAGQSDSTHADLANSVVGSVVLASSEKKAGAFIGFSEESFYGNDDRSSAWNSNHSRLMHEIGD